MEFLDFSSMPPRWALMWAAAIAVYGALKILSWERGTRGTAPAWRHAAYLLAWPGMAVEKFLHPPATGVKRPSPAEWIFAASKTGFGIALFALAIRLSPVAHSLVTGWVALVGLGFLLHFGIFHLLSCCWRACGLDAPPIMNWPIATRSLADFWGRRWNTAFRDLTHRFLFLPWQHLLGPTGAMISGFLVSGLLHDLVVSIPAGAGYGLPTLYFLLQGAGIILERSRIGRRAGLGRGMRGWLFCFVILVLPVPLLFHPPFINRVIVPFVEAVGRLA